MGNKVTAKLTVTFTAHLNGEPSWKLHRALKALGEQVSGKGFAGNSEIKDLIYDVELGQEVSDGKTQEVTHTNI